MAKYAETRVELRSLLIEYREMKKKIFLHYQKLVSIVLLYESFSQKEIQDLLDGLVDFCDDPKFYKLYKALCGHVYKQYPQLVENYVRLFRVQFEELQDPEIPLR